MSIVTLPPVSRADEIRFGRDVSAWLASQTSPANAILWHQNWNATIFVDHVGTLRRLIAALPRGQYAGLTRKGSHGPWAQVRAFEDRRSHVSGWPFELHPHTWTLGIPREVWKLISDDTATSPLTCGIGYQKARHPPSIRNRRRTRDRATGS